MKTFRGDDGLYHYLYKTTNLINKKYYIGIHSTDDLDDGYLGSGVYLKKAIKKYGRQNFSKEFLGFYSTRQELSYAERCIVTEDIVTNPNTYNLILGGDSVIDNGGITTGMVTVKNALGQTFLVRKDDPKYISGEYVFIRTGIGAYKDKCGNIINTSSDDPRVLSGELVGASKGKLTVQDKVTGKYISIDKELFDDSIHNIQFINLDGRKFYKWVRRGDEIKSIHTSQLQEYLDAGWKIGNHHKGLICITNGKLNMRIRPDQLQEYLDAGWERGTNQQYNSGGTRYKGYTYVHKDDKCIRVSYDDIISYLDRGWSCGMRKSKCKQYMHNSDQVIRVTPDQFESYVRSGYKFGKK